MLRYARDTSARGTIAAKFTVNLVVMAARGVLQVVDYAVPAPGSLNAGRREGREG
jgi:hypothetical protein